jgi:hypothetical protein
MTRPHFCCWRCPRPWHIPPLGPQPDQNPGLCTHCVHSLNTCKSIRNSHCSIVDSMSHLISLLTILLASLFLQRSRFSESGLYGSSLTSFSSRVFPGSVPMRGLSPCNVLRSTRLRTRWISILLDMLRALVATKSACALFALSPSRGAEKGQSYS